MKSHPSDELPSKLEFETALIAQARTMLNESVERLLVATRGNSEAAYEAAEALVAGLLRAGDALHAEAEAENASVREVLSICTRWPTCHYPFPEDRKKLAARFRELGFGLRSPLNINARKHWGNGTAISWALEFYTKVQDAKNDPLCRSLRTAPTRLPELSADPVVLKEWHKLACEYFTARSPGKNLAQHPDWKNSSATSSKIRSELKLALSRMANSQTKS